MKPFAVALAMFAFPACATASSTAPAAPAPSLQLPSKVSGDIELAKLAPLDILQLERRGQVRTDVAVCVSPDGRVADARLVAGSGIEAYDHALVTSVRQWTYQRYLASEGSRVCKTVSIVYKRV